MGTEDDQRAEKNDLKARIAEWQSHVLQLDRRNGLLYFKPGRTSVHIVTSDVDNLCQALEDARNGLSFDHVQPRGKQDQKNLFGPDGNKADESEPDFVVIKGDLETEGDPLELQKRLYALQRRDREWLEEQGINVLFLAIGSLQWVDDEGTRAVAPLFLCPCDLERKSPRDPFILVKEEDDPVHNSTLRQKLRTLGVDIPELGQETPSEYLFKVREAIRGKADWAVREEVFLATFVFSKLAIWEDLDAMRKQGVDHPLVRCLAGDIGSLKEEQEKHPSPFPPAAELAGGRLDDLVGVKNEHTVMEADYSQLISIERARAGAHIVIHGPPGTGKSQTIANIIAGLLADGKRVLFVSEKTAALDVVKRRLVDCALGVFCLDLHSERGRKASVYGQLRESIEECRTRARGASVEKLELVRTQLNTLTREIHKIREPIGLTVFQVQGRLSLLQDYPKVDFKVAGVDTLTGDRLSQIEGALDKIRRRQCDYAEHGTSRWRALKARTGSLRLASDIRDAAKALGGAIAGLERESEAVGHWLGTSRPQCVREVSKLIQLLGVLSVCPGAPSAWCTLTRRQTFRDLYGRAIPQVERWQNLNAEVTRFFAVTPPLESIPALIGLFTIERSSAEACRNILGRNWDRVLLAKHGVVAERLAELETALLRLLQAYNALLAHLVARPVEDSLDQVSWALEKSLALRKLPVLPPVWSSVEGVHKIVFLANNAKECRDTLAAAESALESSYSLRLVDAADEDLLLRFKVDHQSFWRRLFSGQYRRDWRIVAGNKTSPGKPVLQEIVPVLEQVMQIRGLRSGLLTQLESIAKASSGVFDPSVADLDGLSNLLAKVLPILGDELLAGDQLGQLLCSKDAKGEIELARSEVLKKLKALALSTDSLLKECVTSSASVEVPPVIAYLEGVSHGSVDPAVPLREVLEGLALARTVTKALGEARSRLDGFVSGNEFSLDALVSALRAAQERNEVDRILNDIWRDLHSEVPVDLIPKEKDWRSLGSAAQWLAKHGDALPEALTDNLKSHLERPQPKETYLKAANQLNALIVELLQKHSAAGLVFDLSETPCMEAETFRLETGSAWTDDILEDPESAHSWLDYMGAVAEVHGLLEDGVIDRVWQATDNADEVPGVVLRRVYEEWLDQVYAGTRKLRTTAPDLDALRQNFKDLDRTFVLANRERVRERCFEKYPDQRLPTRGLGELGQLQTELSKKKRQRPVRWLMEKIPNVVQSLKPCFLMSPLAVSQYLPRSLDGEGGPAFDTVIFDEASQVFPWDAVPALSRANQAIVVGDEQQLPPTHFFRSQGADDDDYEVEEDDVTTESLTVGRESILDVMVGLSGLAAEEYSLMVHYRSRHEDLIRYSNRCFYDSRLLVFPTASPNRLELGIRDVYLPDARYDAGGTKTNRLEAEAVVSKVFELMKARPINESIGVVALSRAQADLIEHLLNDRRLAERALDDRFAENRQERFFVKNLENVQGDERDHIILDIGYGPTVGSNAVPNRFGPLNAEGGHRRLNVAVSRARMSLTVLHSLRPQDIHSEQPGPRLLRRYLEFVASPMGALEAGEVRPTADEPEGDFETAVYRALISRGHKVVCQVGCNGYFIDLAITSDDGSSFDLGIECDGATYHSSPSARDRDWQRQHVLEGLGWTIHRIWSRSWILDPAREIAKVEEALQQARHARTEPALAAGPASLDVDPPNKFREEVQATESETVFAPYRRVCFNRTPHHDMTSADENELALRLVEVVKAEQPVHEQVAWKRLRILYGNARIGQVIEEKLRRAQRVAVRESKVAYLDDTIGGERHGKEYLCLPGFEKAIPRGKDPSGGRSRITEISFAELGAGVEAIVSASFGIAIDDAIVAAARAFGFSRTGEDIRGRLSTTIECLLRSGRLAEKDGKLFTGNH